MAIARINTDEERARLDAIFAEIEAERIINEQPKQEPKAEPQQSTKTVAEQRLESQGLKQIMANVRCMLKDNSFKTKWERVLAKTLVNIVDNGEVIDKKELASKNEEINLLRNFANGVRIKLDKAERTAKEQDNHHYYKIFTDNVKELLKVL